MPKPYLKNGIAKIYPGGSPRLARTAATIVHTNDTMPSAIIAMMSRINGAQNPARNLILLPGNASDDEERNHRNEQDDEIDEETDLEIQRLLTMEVTMSDFPRKMSQTTSGPSIPPAPDVKKELSAER